MSDAEAIRRVLHGEEECFQVICDRYAGKLFGLFFRMCGDPQLADELRVDALTKAYRKLATWRGEGRFWFWLRRLATSLAQDRLRYQGRRKRPLSFEELRPDQEPSSPGPEAEHEVRVQNERLYQALAQLTESEAETAWLRAEGKKLREIAQITGRSIGTVGSELHRALMKLREQYR